MSIESSQLGLLTNACCDNTQEQQDDGDVRLRNSARGHVLKKHSVVGPVDRGAVGQQWLITASPQRISVFLPLAYYPSELRGGVGGDVGHQQAKIHRTARSKHRAHTQQQAAQVDAA